MDIDREINRIILDAKKGKQPEKIKQEFQKLYKLTGNLPTKVKAQKKKEIFYFSTRFKF